MRGWEYQIGWKNEKLDNVYDIDYKSKYKEIEKYHSYDEYQ